MQKPNAREYAELKEFLAFYSERYHNLQNFPPEHHPIACLSVLEAMSKTMALNGLRQAIHDCIEASLRFDNAEVAILDSELRKHGIVTLSELRRRYSGAYARIAKRGRIRNETEYYLINNVLNDPTPKNDEERELLLNLIAEYEDSR
jgi:hypothetical protein